MSEQDLAELQRRIGAALSRISEATEGLSGSRDNDLGIALDAARASEKKARDEADVLAEKIARLEEALETESLAVEQLRERNNKLKQAKEEAQAKTLELDAELTKLKERRGEDRDELDAVLMALEPLVAEQTDA